MVPMFNHVGHSDHSVDVVVTERGLVDTRPLTPRQTAEQIIPKCAHPDCREPLWEYYQQAVFKGRTRTPSLLEEAFFLHQRHPERGDMRAR